jgi:hypothetical protein
MYGVALLTKMLSQPDFQSHGFGAGFDRVVSRIEPSLQPEPQPLTPPLTSFPETAGSLAASSVLGKSGLRGQSRLTDVHIRILRIEPGTPLVRNLNHIDAVHVPMVASLRERRALTGACLGGAAKGSVISFGDRAVPSARQRRPSVGTGRAPNQARDRASAVEIEPFKGLHRSLTFPVMASTRRYPATNPR